MTSARAHWPEHFEIALRASPGVLKFCNFMLALAVVVLALVILARSEAGTPSASELVLIASMMLAIICSWLSIRRQSLMRLVVRVTDTVDCEIDGKRIELLPYCIRIGDYQCLRFRYSADQEEAQGIARKLRLTALPQEMVIGRGSASPELLVLLYRWMVWRASTLDE